MVKHLILLVPTALALALTVPPTRVKGHAKSEGSGALPKPVVDSPKVPDDVTMYTFPRACRQHEHP